MVQVTATGQFLPHWRILGTSHQGTDHLNGGLPCQDAFAYGIANSLLWIAVADGLGSEDYSEQGAQLAVKEVGAQVRTLIALGGLSGTERELRDIVAGCRQRLIGEADRRQSVAGKFATTLQVLLIDMDQQSVRYASVGDGHCIASLEGRYQIIGGDRRRPDIGTAHLLHDEIKKYLYIATLELKKIDAVLLFTDGLDDLFLKRRAKALGGNTVNVDAIGALAKYVREADAEGRGLFGLNTLVGAKDHAELSDDKTLVALFRSDNRDNSSSQAQAPNRSHERLAPPDVEHRNAEHRLSVPLPAARTLFDWTTVRRTTFSALPWVQTALLILVLGVLAGDKLTNVSRSVKEAVVPSCTGKAEPKPIVIPAQIMTEQIGEAQQLLKVLGYFDGEIDKQFGTTTKAAIERFQTDNKLDVSGSLSASLLELLRQQAKEKAAK